MAKKSARAQKGGSGARKSGRTAARSRKRGSDADGLDALKAAGSAAASRRRGPRTDRKAGPVSRLAAVIAALALAVSLFAAGFGACTLPQTTRAFSAANSDFQTAPYGHDQLIGLAVATRDYTVEHTSRAELDAKIVAAARASASREELGKTDRWTIMATASDLFNYDKPADQIAAALGENDRYGLPEDAIEHLDDCYALISAVVPWLWGIAACALVLLVGLRVTGHARQCAHALIAGPLILLGCMVALGAWAAVDFDAFFAAFHGLLFPQGNWTFPSDSLLICMLPEGFWMCMGALWLAVTVIACIISVALGRRMAKRAA